jgi:hypothetical protein
MSDVSKNKSERSADNCTESYHANYWPEETGKAVSIEGTLRSIESNEDAKNGKQGSRDRHSEKRSCQDTWIVVRRMRNGMLICLGVDSGSFHDVFLDRGGVYSVGDLCTLCFFKLG